MKKVHFHLGCGIAGADHDEIFEYEDDVSGEEINEDLEDWCCNILDKSWWIEDE